MAYVVRYADGHESVAADVGTLRAWQLDGRLTPDSTVVDVTRGVEITAGELADLLERGTAPRPSAPVRPAESAWPIVSVCLWSAGALVLFFVFRGWGLIVAAFTLFDAIRLKAAGSKWGNAALAVSVLTLVVLGIGWAQRMGEAGPQRPSTPTSTGA